MAERGGQPGAADSRIAWRDEIAAAAARIAGRVRVTPCLDLTLEGHALTLKLECLQVSGTFKARGAFNRLLSARVLSILFQ